LAGLKARLAEINDRVGDQELSLPQETLSLTERLMLLADKTKAYLETGGD
jgi:hypothetical protein